MRYCKQHHRHGCGRGGGGSPAEYEARRICIEMRTKKRLAVILASSNHHRHTRKQQVAAAVEDPRCGGSGGGSRGSRGEPSSRPVSGVSDNNSTLFGDASLGQGSFGTWHILPSISMVDSVTCLHYADFYHAECSHAPGYITRCRLLAAHGATRSCLSVRTQPPTATGAPSQTSTIPYHTITFKVQWPGWLRTRRLWSH